MTLSQVIQMIEWAASCQPAVNMIVRQDARRLNDCPDAYYGAFAWVQGTHSHVIGEGSMQYQFSLFYIDRLTADRKNEAAIQSVGIEVLDNVLRTIDGQDGVFGVSEAQFTPFDYRFADECAGIYTTVRIEVEAPDGGVCEEMFDGYEIGENVKITI